MRLVITSAILAACTISPAVGDDGVMDRIMAACSRDWGSNYAMIEHCRDRQVAAGRNVIALRDGQAARAPYSTMLADCFARWSEGDDTNWAMTERCFERQSEAYKRLQVD